MTDHEKTRIEEEFASKQKAQEIAARQAWRGLLVPAVGSAAFFASAVVGFIRTYRKYGFPHDAFKPFDYALMGIPFVIIGMAFFYQSEEAELESNGGSSSAV